LRAGFVRFALLRADFAPFALAGFPRFALLRPVTPTFHVAVSQAGTSKTRHMYHEATDA
jgi:hypothetical protein